MWMPDLQRIPEETIERSRGIWRTTSEEPLRAQLCRQLHMDNFNPLDTNLFLDIFNIPENSKQLDKINIWDNHNVRLRMSP